MIIYTSSPSLMTTHVTCISTYMLRSKGEVMEACKVFKAEVEKQCDKQIKIVRSDGGGEYYGRYTENG